MKERAEIVEMVFMTDDITLKDEEEAIMIFNSKKGIFEFMVTSAGSIGPSKLTRLKKND